MLTNYVENVAWIRQTSYSSCSFTDENKMTPNLKPYAKKICAYKIMWTNWEDFRPTSKVNRAELGTTISRMLWWDRYDVGWKEFYIYHLNALKDAGIMNNIENPAKTLARRWDTFIILKRLSDTFGDNIKLDWSTNSNNSLTKISDNSLTKTYNNNPVTRKTDKNGFSYYDSYQDNPRLSNTMKDMKLRSTYCPNIFCQQVADDGTYNNQKHYYWNDSEWTMTLIPWVYYISDCAYYDRIYWNDDSFTKTEDNKNENTVSKSDSKVTYVWGNWTEYFYDEQFIKWLKVAAEKKWESDLAKYLKIELEFYANVKDAFEFDPDKFAEEMGIDFDDVDELTQKEKEEIARKFKNWANNLAKTQKKLNNEYVKNLWNFVKNIENDQFKLKDKYERSKENMEKNNEFVEDYCEILGDLIMIMLTDETNEEEYMATALSLMWIAMVQQNETEQYQAYLDNWAKETIKLLWSESKNSDKSLTHKTIENHDNSSNKSWIDDVTKNYKWDIIRAEDLVSKKENKHSAYVKLEKRTLFIDEEYNYILKFWPEFIWYTMEVYYNDINEVAEIYMRSNSDDIWFQVRVKPRDNCKYINFKYGNEYIWGANDERVFTRYSSYKNDWAELITNVKSWKTVDELEKQHNCKAQWF